MDLSDLRVEHFAPLVGGEVAAAGPDGSRVMLELVEASPLPSSGDRGEAFSIVVLAPPGTLPSQGTIEIEHPAIGRHAVFVVPIGADAQGVRYEAVFTRPLEGS